MCARSAADPVTQLQITERLAYTVSENKKIKVAFVSLGCPKNQIDSEVMLAKLGNAGFEIVEEDIFADVVVVNTCAFIKSAKEEAIETILDVAWLRENRDLRGIVVTGCLAQRYGDELLSEIPEVDAVCGVGNLDDIIDAVRHAYEHGGKKDAEKFKAISCPEAQALGGDRAVTPPEYSAYIKISEGCDNRCTYCIIPYLRGKFRSRTIEDIVAEARDLAALGTKELVVVSQDTTRYGLDLYGEFCLDKLLCELCKIDGIEWIRLLYCYPDEITDSLIDVIAKEEKIVKYIDIPIQHISDNVLKAMNRRGDGALVRECVKKLRERIPDVVLRTTVIVGFPGETKENFAELAEYLKQAQFDRLGVFTYSAEEGTPAARIKDGKVPEKTKQHRLDVIMRNQMEIHEKNNKKFVGKTLRVLCDGFDIPSGVHSGRCYADAPEIDGKVFFTAKRKLPAGIFVDVKVTDAIEYDLYGEVAE